MAGEECQYRIRVLAFFVKDAGLEKLRGLPESEVLVSSLQAKYPDHLGLP